MPGPTRWSTSPELVESPCVMLVAVRCAAAVVVVALAGFGGAACGSSTPSALQGKVVCPSTDQYSCYSSATNAPVHGRLPCRLSANLRCSGAAAGIRDLAGRKEWVRRFRRDLFHKRAQGGPARTEHRLERLLGYIARATRRLPHIAGSRTTGGSSNESPSAAADRTAVGSADAAGNHGTRAPRSATCWMRHIWDGKWYFPE